jgi:CDP-glucose 4,6-dehydratase
LRNPNAIRPWQHVIEPLSGYLFLAARMLKEPHARWCTGWNFGPYTGEEARVGELVELFCRAWGAGQGRDVSTPGQLHEAGILRLNIDNAATVLGWKPRWNLETTVQRTAAWYQRYHRDRQASMRPACLEDLAVYGGI